MVTIPGSPAAENKASGEGSGRVDGKQGREDGSALLELASFLSKLKVGQWSRSLLCEPSRGGEHCPISPTPALKFGRSPLSFFPWS